MDRQKHAYREKKSRAHARHEPTSLPFHRYIENHDHTVNVVDGEWNDGENNIAKKKKKEKSKYRRGGASKGNTPLIGRRKRRADVWWFSSRRGEAHDPGAPTFSSSSRISCIVFSSVVYFTDWSGKSVTCDTRVFVITQCKCFSIWRLCSRGPCRSLATVGSSCTPRYVSSYHPRNYISFRGLFYQWIIFLPNYEE